MLRLATLKLVGECVAVIALRIRSWRTRRRHAQLLLAYERPALLNSFATFPAASKVALASAAVMATVVSTSDRLPPPAAASTADAAALLSGNSPMTNQSWGPKVPIWSARCCSSPNSRRRDFFNVLAATHGGQDVRLMRLLIIGSACQGPFLRRRRSCRLIPRPPASHSGQTTDRRSKTTQPRPSAYMAFFGKPGRCNRTTQKRCPVGASITTQRSKRSTTLSSATGI